jgi:hypothetical protein
MASDLQSRLDSLRPGDTLKLDPPGREFQGPLTVRNPVVIEGQGGTIWAKQGPVLVIETDGVTLQNVNVEVTGKEAGPDGEGGCAVRVLPGRAVKLQHVSVRGTVTGLADEEGTWGYPRELTLRSMKPNKAHEFKARLIVPVPCQLVSKIDNLTVTPAQLQPGQVEIALNIGALPPGTRLRGEIWLQTSLLTRKIQITGNVLKDESTAGDPGTGGPLFDPAKVSQTTATAQTEPIAQPQPGKAATDVLPRPDSTPTMPTSGTIPLAPATFVVSKLGEGQFQSLADALSGAPTGARILVRPGRYKESVVLHKRVEIVGDGARSDIVLEGKDGACIEMRADYARVRGLTLCGRAGLGSRGHPAVSVPQGQLVLEDCDISSDSLACVAVQGSAADPVVRHCRIHDSRSAGLLFADRAEGLVEDCEIHGNANAGVEIREEAKPSVRRCKIFEGRQGGVLVHDRGKGVLEHCEISANTLAGVEIASGGDPTLRRCKICDGQYAGILVHGQGLGTVEDCDLLGNALSGVEVRDARPTVRRCKVLDGKSGGLLFSARAQGTVEDCDIAGHPLAGVTVRGGSAPTLRRCRVHGSRHAGMLFLEKSRGTAESCEVYGNDWAGVAVLHGAEPALKRCQIRDGKMAGLVVAESAAGTAEDCEIRGNDFVGVAVCAGGRPALRNCRIHNNGDVGLWAYDKAAGEVVGGDFSGNTRAAVEVARDCTVRLSKNKGVPG